MRHAHTHNAAAKIKAAGAIGWCAFDYNTHDAFGSGDRICYHGVMDMFRQPKMAASFYASQEDPQRRVVLEPGTYWRRGDVSGGFGQSRLIVFSNCDEIEAKGPATARRVASNPLETSIQTSRIRPFIIDVKAGAMGRSLGGFGN